MQKHVSHYIGIKQAPYMVVYVTLPSMLFTAQLPLLLSRRPKDIITSPNIKVFLWTRLLNKLDNKLKEVKTLFFSYVSFYKLNFLRIRKIIQNVPNFSWNLLSTKHAVGSLSYYPDRNYIGYEIWLSSLNQ